MELLPIWKIIFIYYYKYQLHWKNLKNIYQIIFFNQIPEKFFYFVSQYNIINIIQSI